MNKGNNLQMRPYWLKKVILRSYFAKKPQHPLELAKSGEQIVRGNDGDNNREPIVNFARVQEKGVLFSLVFLFSFKPISHNNMFTISIKTKGLFRVEAIITIWNHDLVICVGDTYYESWSMTVFGITLTIWGQIHKIGFHFRARIAISSLQSSISFTVMAFSSCSHKTVLRVTVDAMA